MAGRHEEKRNLAARLRAALAPQITMGKLRRYEIVLLKSLVVPRHVILLEYKCEVELT